MLSVDSIEKAERAIRDVFDAGSMPPETLPGLLEQTLALGSNSWPLETIRRLGDLFLELREGRRKSPAHEVRWLNLCGLCLRPGFGFPGDDYRIERARRMWAQGLQFANKVECETQWWIFWGRVAGGLNRNQQSDVFQRLSYALLPKGKAPRLNASLLREMQRAAASLELLPAGTRTDLGNALVKQMRAGTATPSEFWCLARLGARKLFYGPNNQVLPAAVVQRWIEAITKSKGGRRVPRSSGPADRRPDARRLLRYARTRAAGYCVVVECRVLARDSRWRRGPRHREHGARFRRGPAIGAGVARAGVSDRCPG